MYRLKNNIKTNRKKRITIYLLMAVVLFGLAGCKDKRKTGDEIRDDILEGQGDIAGNTNGETNPGDNIDFGEADGLSEHLKYDIKNGDAVVLRVDADVEVPDVRNQKMYKVSYKDMNANAIKTMATELFDDGEYEVDKSIKVMTLSEL